MRPCLDDQKVCHEEVVTLSTERREGGRFEGGLEKEMGGGISHLSVMLRLASLSGAPPPPPPPTCALVLHIILHVMCRDLF